MRCCSTDYQASLQAGHVRNQRVSAQCRAPDESKHARLACHICSTDACRMCWPSVATPCPAGAASWSSPASSCSPLTCGAATSTAQPLGWPGPCTTCSSCRMLREAALPIQTGKSGSSGWAASPGRRYPSPLHSLPFQGRRLLPSNSINTSSRQSQFSKAGCPCWPACLRQPFALSVCKANFTAKQSQVTGVPNVSCRHLAWFKGWQHGFLLTPLHLAPFQFHMRLLLVCCMQSARCSLIIESLCQSP